MLTSFHLYSLRSLAVEDRATTSSNNLSHASGGSSITCRAAVSSHILAGNQSVIVIVFDTRTYSAASAERDTAAVCKARAPDPRFNSEARGVNTIDGLRIQSAV